MLSSLIFPIDSIKLLSVNDWKLVENWGLDEYRVCVCFSVCIFVVAEILSC